MPQVPSKGPLELSVHARWHQEGEQSTARLASRQARPSLALRRPASCVMVWSRTEHLPSSFKSHRNERTHVDVQYTNHSYFPDPTSPSQRPRGRSRELRSVHFLWACGVGLSTTCGYFFFCWHMGRAHIPMRLPPWHGRPAVVPQQRQQRARAARPWLRLQHRSSSSTALARGCARRRS